MYTSASQQRHLKHSCYWCGCMEVTDSRAFLQCHHLHNISVSISSSESDSELRAISSAIAHFERLQETASQCALTLCHAVFPVLRLPFLLSPSLRQPASQCAPDLTFEKERHCGVWM